MLVLFVFAHKKYSHSGSIMVELFDWRTDCYVSRPGNIALALLSMGGSESSQIWSKIS